MSDSEAVLTERRENNVLLITINRPEVRNAVNGAVAEGIAGALDELDAEDSLSVGVLTGGGGFFCAGMDLGAFVKGESPWFGDRGFAGIAQRASRKPLIAAIEGFAVAGGMEIALACDLIVASETARFSQIFRRIGLAPDGGAIWFLTRRIGMAKAKELVFTARFVEAAEALTLGLVNEVVPDDQLMPRAEALAADLASGPTFAFGLAKKLFHMASSPSYEDFLDMEAFVQPQLDQTEDHREGVAAFKEKRQPNFVGR